MPKKSHTPRVVHQLHRNNVKGMKNIQTMSKTIPNASNTRKTTDVTNAEMKTACFARAKKTVAT